MLDSSQRTNTILKEAATSKQITMATTQASALDWKTSINLTQFKRTNNTIINEHTTPLPVAVQTTLPFLAWPWPKGESSDSNSSIVNPLILTSSNNFSITIPRFANHTTDPGGITTTATPTTDDDNDVLHSIEYIGAILSFYYVPIIVCTGSLGNILSVAVFFKTKLRKLTSSIYLGALAISDTCFLFGLFAQWLNFVDIHIYNREYFCQFFTYFSNLACFCSNWFVVAFTVERFIAVMYPLKRQTMCTVRRAKMVLLGLTLLGCLHCAPFLFSSTPVYSPKAEMTLCDIRNEYKDYITILNYWDTLVVFAIPFTTIAVLNTFTGCTVWKFATVRRTLTMQKIKTQHLPQYQKTIVSTNVPLNGDTTTVSMTTTTATVAGLGVAAAATDRPQQKHSAATTYRLQSTTSIKRHRFDCCATAQAPHLDGPCELHRSHSHRGSMQHHQCSQNHQQRQFSMGTRNLCRGNSCAEMSRKSGRRKSVNSSQLKVTKMLLIVSTVFVCLNLPSFIMRMITFLETQTSTNEKTTIVLQYIFQLFFITNFGINFVLYCVSGQNFRKAFLSIFRRVPSTQRDVTTQITSKYVSEHFCPSGCGQVSGGIGANASNSTSRSVSTRRRMLVTQSSWNESHEMQNIK